MAELFDYGSDVSTFPVGGVPDLDPTFAPITGTLAVAETVARGLLMPRGRLVDINGEQRVGFWLRSYLGARIDARRLQEIKNGCEREARFDERVLTATAQVTHDSVTNTLTIKLSGQTRAGPFSLVLAVGKLTSELLEAA